MTCKTSTLTRSRLQELLTYDPLTGVFRWRVNRNARAMAGDIAGCIAGGGYRYIGIDGVYHRANRLAVLYMTGRFPTGDVDHKNEEKADDRFANLREATKSQNMHNVPARTASGYKGVYSVGKKFQAGIRLDGKLSYLGTFPNAEEAARAYDNAARSHHGDFARTNFT